MSELKVIDVDKMADVRSLSGQFYRKSEVDEVISTNMNHQKYKRCMAMARWCDAEQYAYPSFGTGSPKEKWWQKWYKRWLELAEQFNEEK